MAVLNYKFIASGIGNIVKANIYPLVPVKESEPVAGGEFATTGIKAPIGYGKELMGKFFAMPLFIQGSKSINTYIEIPEAVISVSKRKTVVSTPVVGGNGTVKEFIADDDRDISIMVGIVATDPEGYIIDEYPADGVKDLCALLDLREPLLITSDFLEMFDIDGGTFKVVVTEYSVTQSTHSNRQQVNIKAISDYDYVIFNEEN
jgi:hypothetical protein